MERDKKARKAIRSAFTTIYNKLNADIKREDINKEDIQANFSLLEQRANELKKFNDVMFQHLLDKDANEGELNDETTIADEYQRKFNKIQIEVLNILKHVEIHPHAEQVADLSISNSSRNTARKFKLPDIELKKFGGDIKDWIHFWGQFRKIDEDNELANEDKFQYLIQATKEGRRAREFVNSYPPSADNYENIMKGLKARFGQEDMLIEVYVRELLTLVLKKVLSKENLNLCVLYDQLESYLRALESLGVTSEKYAAMLYPLVESSLPEDLLRTCQRMSTMHKEEPSEASSHESSTTDKRLKKLMYFLSKEVQNEERIKMANTGFDFSSSSKGKKKGSQIYNEINTPTAASLVSVTNEKVSKINNCIFCDKKHNSVDCFHAKKMSLNEKKKIIEDKKCCFYCLKGNHFARKCKIFIKCTICDGRHVTLMCPNLNNCRENYNQKKTIDEKLSTDTNLTSSISNPEVLLQTLFVKLKNKDKNVCIRAIIDTGSQKSYISENVINEMNFECLGRVKLAHALFGGVETEQKDHKRYNIAISSIDDEYICNIEVLSQSTIVSEIPHIKKGVWTQEIQELGIHLTDIGKVKGPIQLLIGADVAGKLFTGEQKILNCGLVVLGTKLGWTILGKVPQEQKKSNVIGSFSKTEKIQDLWELDVLGIRDPVEVKLKREKEALVNQAFLENIKINEDGRYEVKLPWITDKPDLPTNEEIAKRRLTTLTRKLEAEGNLEKYDEVIQDWSKEGIVEEIQDWEGGHYLPHRHVVKENSTTKLRPVFDASAKTKKIPSLNDCLEVGPNLIELIPSVLLRFRLQKIGVISDIKRAFLQISLCEDDRNYLKFMWWNEHNERTAYRHNRVVFGVASSPFLLGGVINYHLNKTLNAIKSDSEEEHLEDTVKRLMRSFYVDNCVTSVADQDELHKFMSESKTVMSRACFELRGWEYTSDMYAKLNPLTSVLGLKWNKDLDTLEINLSAINSFNEQVVTKRLILSTTHKLFDPIGFICPINIIPKLMLQQTWQSGIGWDAEVDEDTRSQFQKWYRDLHLLSQIKVPRVKTEDKINVQLIQAKSRVAPLKKMTIPRLELMSATIGARLTNEVMTNLDWKGKIPVTYWTDSSTVLTWIQKSEKWEVFVRNRIQEIRQMTNIEEWQHIPGENNPADLPSRGCSIKQLVELRWWEGPEWLKLNPEEWPQSTGNLQMESLEKNRTSTTLAVETGNLKWYRNYFSDYQKIVRLIAWIIRFSNNCKTKKEKRFKGSLTVEEIKNAEKQIFKLIQQEFYNGGNVNKLATLNTVRDQEGIIRVKTKVILREDTDNFKYPIVLPDQHRVVKLLIMDKHKKLMHAGTQILLNSLREDFWITRGRKVVRSVINSCVKCKRHTIKNSETVSCPLPLNRVRDARVFEVTGVDYAGPLHLKEGKKAWICLFTCAIYRAVHIELVTSLSTLSFIQALRRFIARRGRPKTFYSDNGTNIVGTENLMSSVDWDNIVEYATVQRIEWKFNPPTAAWWGGWWERLIRIIKDLLKRVLGKACLRYEEMLTLLNECEAVVNSRPLTYMMDGDPSVTAISPSMFLQEITEVGVPDLDEADENTLNKRLMHINKLRTHLRQRFRNEYLGSLKQKPDTNIATEKLKIGELVLVGSENKKRLDWPLAKVIELFLLPGQDGECRLVKLKTVNGEFLRPIQRLYRLELGSACEMDCNKSNTETKTVKISEKEHKVQSTRSGRKIVLPKRYT